jgi:hypothetical protein
MRDKVNDKVMRGWALVFWGLVILVLGAGRLHSANDELSARLSRTNLLTCHNGRGEIAAVHSRADWELRRAEILFSFQKIAGPLPGKERRCPLDMTVEETVDCGSYVRFAITYASEPGSRVPAFLLVPRTAGLPPSLRWPTLSNPGDEKPAARLLSPTGPAKRFSAILALHPTDMENGNRVVVEAIRAHYPAYATDLAAHGYVVLAPAYPLMARYQPDLKGLGYQSGTMKAIWDNIRGLDLLDSLPFVKRGAFGAIGHSLGGHNAVFTGVFDSRLKVIITSCGFDSFLDYKDGNIQGWTSERYMPKLLAYRDRLAEIPFDFHELIAALAPRWVFINAPLHDSNFKFKSVDGVVKAAEPIYSLYRAPRTLRVEHPDCGHEFPPELRDRAYRFLDEALRR